MPMMPIASGRFGRDLHVEHDVVEAERLAHVGSELGVVVDREDARAVVTEGRARAPSTTCRRRTPRGSCCASRRFRPVNVAPMVAIGTTIPGLMFGAPADHAHRRRCRCRRRPDRNLSAFGCLRGRRRSSRRRPRRSRTGRFDLLDLRPRLSSAPGPDDVAGSSTGTNSRIQDSGARISWAL